VAALTKRKRLLFISIYIVVFAAVVEGFSQLVFQIPRIYWRLYTDEDYSWKRIWVQQHQQSGSDVYYTLDDYDPMRGWASKPNLRNAKVFENKILNTNARGLRGTKDFAYGKNGRRRIVLLGDSFTFGEEVSDDETYAHFLQEMLPDVDVINLGVHGYGHDQMLIFFETEGVRYEPDIVILGFLKMDMERNLLSFRDFAKPRFVVRGGQLELTGVPVPRPEDVLAWDWTRPRTLDILSILSFRFRDRFGLREREMQTTTTAILARLIEVTRGVGATPVFAYLPHRDEMTSQVDRLPGETFMFSLCRPDNGAQCLSTRPRFLEKAAGGETFKVAGHWDAAGHRAVAEALQRFLVRQGHLSVP
jgi:hypothetical protein